MVLFEVGSFELGWNFLHDSTFRTYRRFHLPEYMSGSVHIAELYYLRELFVNDCRLTNNVEESRLAPHWNSIDLAHIFAPVLFFDILDVYGPVPATAVRHCHSVVPRYHCRMNCQNLLLLYLEPTNLKTNQIASSY